MKNVPEYQVAIMGVDLETGLATDSDGIVSYSDIKLAVEYFNSALWQFENLLEHKGWEQIRMTLMEVEPVHISDSITSRCRILTEVLWPCEDGEEPWDFEL